jgi:hypothetical protein
MENQEFPEPFVGSGSPPAADIDEQAVIATARVLRKAMDERDMATADVEQLRQQLEVAEAVEARATKNFDQARREHFRAIAGTLSETPVTA